MITRQGKKPVKTNTYFNQKLLLYALSILLAFLLYHLFTQAFSSKLNQAVGRTNIVILAESVYLLSFPQNSNESVLTLAIPGDTYVQVPYGYGQYQLKSVRALSQLEKKPQLVTDTIADTLGLFINGYIDLQSRSLTSAELFQMIKKLSFTWANLRGDFLTNLNLFDRLLFMKLVNKSGPLDIIHYSLGSAPLVLEETKLPDGSIVQTISESALDNWLANKFEISQVRQQNISVRVVNTTTTAGVGQKFARYLNHLGGNVVSLDNLVTPVASCRVEYVEGLKSLILDFLKINFNCEMVAKTTEGEADLTVFLGTDFANRWR